MTVPMEETRERFLLAIAKEVPPERIAEIHFFAPIRQGGFESGVAVIAAWPEHYEIPVESSEFSETSESPETSESSETSEPSTDGLAEPSELTEPSGVSAVSESSTLTDPVTESPSEEATTEEPTVDEGAVSGVVAIDESIIESLTEQPVEGVEETPEPAPEEKPLLRHVVYTARYRHTLKGLDRGKWETNVVAEADAPLVTVDVVVRGVQRRAGDVDEPTRMDGNEVRAVIAALQRRLHRSSAA